MRYFPSYHLSVGPGWRQILHYSCIIVTPCCIAAALNTVIFEVRKPCRFAPLRAIARADPDSGCWPVYPESPDATMPLQELPRLRGGPHHDRSEQNTIRLAQTLAAPAIGRCDVDHLLTMLIEHQSLHGRPIAANLSFGESFFGVRRCVVAMFIS